MIIRYTKKFSKEYRKLPKEIKLLSEKREDIFRTDPFHPSLKTHKLKGKLKDFYSFSIAYSWRVVFHFSNEDTIILDTIGTHEIYR